jgi:hypothetical protein
VTAAEHRRYTVEQQPLLEAIMRRPLTRLVEQQQAWLKAASKLYWRASSRMVEPKAAGPPSFPFGH